MPHHTYPAYHTTALNLAANAHARAHIAGYTGRRTFHDDLHLHLANGIVYARPDAFVLARGVDSTASARRISDPAYTFDESFQDTWFIYLAAFDPDRVTLQQAIIFLPSIKPFIAYARRGVIHFAPATSFLRRLDRFHNLHRQKRKCAAESVVSSPSPP